jgi:adiponectin receptor
MHATVHPTERRIKRMRRLSSIHFCEIKQRTSNKACHCPVTNIQEIPHNLRGNPYIIGGYREFNYTYLQAAMSTFRLHNETLCIWTHMLPMFAFVILLIWNVMDPKFDTQVAVSTGETRPDDRWFLSLYCMGSIFVTAFSSIFHVFMCCSSAHYFLLSRLDYVGILVHVMFSMVVLMYFIFDCEPVLRKLYTATSVTVCLLSLPVLFSSRFAHKKYDKIRAGTFTSVILTSVVPTAHAYLIGSETLHHILTIFTLSMVSFLLGMIIYVLRWPEKRWPGTFDVFGQSHQLWHICTNFGFIVMYFQMVMARNFLLDDDSPCGDTPALMDAAGPLLAGISGMPDLTIVPPL